MNVARQVFALQLNDHSLSTSAVQFAAQDVNSVPTAASAPETDTFEQVSDNLYLFINYKWILMIILFPIGYPKRDELEPC